MENVEKDESKKVRLNQITNNRCDDSITLEDEERAYMALFYKKLAECCPKEDEEKHRIELSWLKNLIKKLF